MYKIILKINGMKCGMCESHVNDIVRKNFNVKKVTSSHLKGETIFLTKDDVTKEQVVKIINPTGYIVDDFVKIEAIKKGLFWK